MNTRYSRRSFFAFSRSALASVGLASWITPLNAAATPTPALDEGVDYYDKLGIEKIINAAGVFTMFTSSTMPPPVQLAVAKAAKHPVRLKDLQLAAGAYIANKLHCEAALVSAGAASALTLGTAACISVANARNGERVANLIPQQMDGLKNEVIMQKAHRYGYDHALLNCNVKIVEVETIDQYRAAFNAKTVMAHFHNAAQSGTISREDWIRMAHQHDVPCFNDAAADVPPISHLWKYTQMGFDLVTFSGGKGIRGPQNAGLLLGRKDLIACRSRQQQSVRRLRGGAA